MKLASACWKPVMVSRPLESVQSADARKRKVGTHSVPAVAVGETTTTGSDELRPPQLERRVIPAARERQARQARARR